MKGQSVQLPAEARVSETAGAARDARYRETARVTIVGGVLDLILGIAKLVAGYFTYSQALIADGIHSLSDLATDGMVLYAARHSNVEPDAEHPYGHGRFETIATVGLAVALVLVASGIGFTAIKRLFEPELLPHPGVWGLLVATLSIISKEWIYHYTMRVARRQRSDMLRANAWHSRTDAFSSVIVLIGVVGTMAGFSYLDALAAIGVALIIAHIGWTLGWNALKELADTALDQRQVESLRERILDVSGVRGLHLLRTRHAGGQVLVDVHVVIDPGISISEGHHISEKVRSRLLQEFEGVTDVTVHIDPEDDEHESAIPGLPMRSELLQAIRRRLDGIKEFDQIERFTLHYLAGKIQVEALMPFTENSTQESCRLIEQYFEEALKDDPLIESFDIHWH
ncbi:MAG: cation transporter [Proteobacteria bacterium]|nr:cation transporter [Pseudomonadota bacterium]